MLDWFRFAMHLTVFSQCSYRIAHRDEVEDTHPLAALESTTWLARHGNQRQANEEITFFEDDVYDLEVSYSNFCKLKPAVHEFAVYISGNAGSLFNNGERFRSGERIFSCLPESTVNVAGSKCFAKRQRVQWSRRGAHLLLSTRRQALDGTLRPVFERWCPGLANDNGNEPSQAAAE